MARSFFDANVVGLCCNSRVWVLRLALGSSSSSSSNNNNRGSSGNENTSVGDFPKLQLILPSYPTVHSAAKALAVAFAPLSWGRNECAVLYEGVGVVLWDLTTSRPLVLWRGGSGASNNTVDSKAMATACPDIVTFELIPLSVNGGIGTGRAAAVLAARSRILRVTRAGSVIDSVCVPQNEEASASAMMEPTVAGQVCYVAVGTNSGTVMVLDAHKGGLLCSLRQHTLPVKFLNWTTIGDTERHPILASTAFDRTGDVERLIWSEFDTVQRGTTQTVCPTFSVIHSDVAAATGPARARNASKKQSKNGGRSGKPQRSQQQRSWTCTAWLPGQIMLDRKDGHVLGSSHALVTTMPTGQIVISSVGDGVSLQVFRKGLVVRTGSGGRSVPQIPVQREHTTENKHSRTIFCLLPLTLSKPHVTTKRDSRCSALSEEDASPSVSISSSDTDTDDDSEADSMLDDSHSCGSSSGSERADPCGLTKKGRLQSLLSNHRQQIRCSGLAKDNNFLLSLSMDRQVILWKVLADHSVRFVWALPTLGGFPYSLHRNPFRTAKTRMLAIGVGDRSIRLISAERAQAGSAELSSVSSTPRPASAHPATTTCLQPFGPSSTDVPQLFWRGINARVTAVAWHPIVENLLVFGMVDGVVQRLDVGKPSSVGAGQSGGGAVKGKKAPAQPNTGQRRGPPPIAKHRSGVTCLGWRIVEGDAVGENADASDVLSLSASEAHNKGVECEPIALLYSLARQTGELLEVDLRHTGAKAVNFHKRLRTAANNVVFHTRVMGAPDARRNDQNTRVSRAGMSGNIECFSWDESGRFLALSAGGIVHIFECGARRGDPLFLLPWDELCDLGAAVSSKTQDHGNIGDVTRKREVFGYRPGRRGASSGVPDGSGSQSRLHMQDVVWGSSYSGMVPGSGAASSNVGAGDRWAAKSDGNQPPTSRSASEWLACATEDKLEVLGVRIHTQVGPEQGCKVLLLGRCSVLHGSKVTAVAWAAPPPPVAGEVHRAGYPCLQNQMIAVGLSCGAVQVWQASAVAATSDSSKRARAAGEDSCVVDLVPLCSFRGHAAAVLCVEWVDRRTVSSASCDHAVLLWDVFSQSHMLPPEKPKGDSF
eukprot:INCI9361.1.p1 GENE.INCI9361.1~~INCI9361.1.p1  ORF type:complete len:1205 (-),score=141.07 INCI9361.1:1542-4859(-)